MAQCLVHRVGTQFKAWINVQANPNATVTATGGGKSYSAVANTTTGIATILVKKKATYTLSTDCSASYEANGNTAAVVVNQSKATYTAQKVKLNRGFSNLYVSNQYQSNTLLIYWNGSKPSSYCTNYYLQSVTDNDAGIYTGTGSSYTINTSSTVTGYLHSVSSGTSKSYRLTAYLTINGNNYHESGLTASGTATTLSNSTSGSVFKFTSSTSGWTVPAGVRRLSVFCCGGGGSGAYDSGGGGGGGYCSRTTWDVVPGQTMAIIVGAGGAAISSISWSNYDTFQGNSGGTSKVVLYNNGSYVTETSASGGGGGRYASYNEYGSNSGGGNGGSGGSGGGAGSPGRRYSSAWNPTGWYGGDGGSNGGSGGNSGKDWRDDNGVMLYRTRYGGSGQGSSAVYCNGVYYAGGGGGGGCDYTISGESTGPGGITFKFPNGWGGSYGGGRGGYDYEGRKATSGTAGSGGGGGGADNLPTGAGGSGVVILTVV